MCGRLSGIESSTVAGVMATNAAQSLSTIRRLLQAAVIVVIQVARQHPFAAELMDSGRRHTKLLGHFGA